MADEAEKNPEAVKWGQMLVAAREARGLSQRTAALAVKVQPQMLSKWERAERIPKVPEVPIRYIAHVTSGDSASQLELLEQLLKASDERASNFYRLRFGVEKRINAIFAADFPDMSRHYQR